MPKSKLRVFSSLFAMFVLLVGVFAGSKLVQQSQELRKKAATTGKDNILVFLLDDVDEPMFDLMLQNNLLPNIKSYLVDSGIRFKNSFVVNSQCCPSRATYLTGKYSHNTGVWNVVGSEGGAKLFKSLGHDKNNLATWLKLQGYFNGYIGKYMSYTNSLTPEPGWDYWNKIEGYDARPGNYVAYENGITEKPNLYQNKYIYDQTIQFLDNFKTRAENNFFLTVAPRSVHANLPSWTTWKINNVVARYPGTGEVVAFSTYIDPSTNLTHQHAMRKQSDGTYNLYTRNSANWVWGVVDSSWLSGTGNFPIVAYNAFNHPNGSIMHQIIRGTTQEDYVTYTRQVTTTNQGTWTAAVGTSWKEQNGDTKPISAWTTYTQPNNIIRQEIIRGTVETGYDLYYRFSTDWNTWYKSARGWDYNFYEPDNDPIVAWNSYMIDGNTIRHHLARGTLSKEFTTYYTDEVSNYRTNMESSIVSLEPENQISKIIKTANAQISNEATDTPPILEEDVAIAADEVSNTNSYPYYPLISRTYADGNWENIQTNQSFDINLYGGKYPAGKLRLDGKDGFIPKNGLELPGIQLNKPSFNQSGCDEKHTWYCDKNWQSLETSVGDGNTFQDYLTRFNLDRMESMLTIDVMVGETVKKLQAEGLDASTTIIFTSDNGFMLGEFRNAGKIVPIEESIRVPLIVRPAGGTNSSSKDEFVLNIDLAPTILDYSGLDWEYGSLGSTPYNIDGRSLKDLIENNYVNWREYFLNERHSPRDYDITRTVHKLPDLYSIRTSKSGVNQNQYLYVEYGTDPDTNFPTSASGFTEFYDITNDQFEANNLDRPISVDPESENGIIKSDLKQKLAALRNCTGATCRDDYFNLPPISNTTFQSFNSFIHPDTGLLHEQLIRDNVLYDRYRSTDGVWGEFKQLTPTGAVYTQTGTGDFQGFAAFVHPNGNITQMVIRNGKAFRRERVKQGSSWIWQIFNEIPQDNSLFSAGTGTFQAYASFIHPDTNKLKEYIIRGNKIYFRERIATSQWTDFTELNSSDAPYTQTGTGDFEAFSMFVHPNGNLTQQVARNGVFYWRQRVLSNNNWVWNNFSQIPPDNALYTQTVSTIAPAIPDEIVMTPTTPPSSSISGDATNDGLVNGADFIIWFNHYKQSTLNGPTDGDFNDSGIVDGADFIIWFNNYKK